MGWCVWDGKYLTVRPHVALPIISSAEDEHVVNVLSAARAWATATAATHRNDPRRLELAELISPEFESVLLERADAYMKSLDANLEAFRADARVGRDESLQNAQMAAWVADANHTITGRRSNDSH